jgi:catechol 2,3-dioxygenase-like lactoylglutathione lyase family enzyme
MAQAKGILHFTISCTDRHRSAALYRDLLGCEILRVSDKFAFMQCGEQHFVLAEMAGHVSPNPPGGTLFHHAFIMDPENFDRARAEIEARGIAILKYEEAGHRSFPGRHLYIHDDDGNGIEIFDNVGYRPGVGKVEETAAS